MAKWSFKQTNLSLCIERGAGGGGGGGEEKMCRKIGAREFFLKGMD